VNKVSHDREAMRRFAGVELGDERIPDETTILNFRHLLETHALTERLFVEVNKHLAAQGIARAHRAPVAGATPPPARSSLPRYTAEIAHEAPLAKLLTCFDPPNKNESHQRLLGIPRDSGFARNALTRR